MDFSGTAIADKRSFLNDRMGEKLFGSNITIYDDAAFPLQTGAPFDGEGVPAARFEPRERGCTAAGGLFTAGGAQGGS